MEIGAGPGNLTRLLTEEAGSVVTLENDKGILATLRKNLSDYQNVTIIADDVRQWRLRPSIDLPHRGYKLVANIPYYLTSLILRLFLSRQPQPSIAVLLVQNEVADRMTAGPGQMSLLSVSVQYYSRVQKLFVVPREKFWPVPEVDSAAVRIDCDREPAEADRDFFRLVRVGFSSRRKQLHNTLAAGFRLKSEEVIDCLKKIGLEKTVRPQELTIANWLELFQKISANIRQWQ